MGKIFCLLVIASKPLIHWSVATLSIEILFSDLIRIALPDTTFLKYPFWICRIKLRITLTCSREFTHTIRISLWSGKHIVIWCSVYCILILFVPISLHLVLFKFWFQLLMSFAFLVYLFKFVWERHNWVFDDHKILNYIFSNSRSGSRTTQSNKQVPSQKLSQCHCFPKASQDAGSSRSGPGAQCRELFPTSD